MEVAHAVKPMRSLALRVGLRRLVDIAEPRCYRPRPCLPHDVSSSHVLAWSSSASRPCLTLSGPRLNLQ